MNPVYFKLFKYAGLDVHVINEDGYRLVYIGKLAHLNPDSMVVEKSITGANDHMSIIRFNSVFELLDLIAKKRGLIK